MVIQTLPIIGSKGRTVYLPKWMLDFDGKLIGKYTILDIQNPPTT